MTQLLEKAFREAAKLPPEVQDALAAELLEELSSEERWTKAFTNSATLLEQLADEALEQHQRGDTKPLDM